MNNTYALRTNDQLLAHDNWQRLLLHDFDESNDLELEAFAASGDCFEMLANELDQVMLSLQLDSAERFRLQRMIDVLLYLQEHHEIVRR
jgi:hypothetical protein